MELPDNRFYYKMLSDSWTPFFHESILEQFLPIPHSIYYNSDISCVHATVKIMLWDQAFIALGCTVIWGNQFRNSFFKTSFCINLLCTFFNLKPIQKFIMSLFILKCIWLLDLKDMQWLQDLSKCNSDWWIRNNLLKMELIQMWLWNLGYVLIYVPNMIANEDKTWCEIKVCLRVNNYYI